jgi:hypothetical protein
MPGAAIRLDAELMSKGPQRQSESQSHISMVELRGLETLTFSLRRPDTQAKELLRRMLFGA